MTSTETAPYQRGVVQGEVIQPTSFASAKETASHDLAQVLIQLIHGATHSFHNETAKLAAVKTVNKWAEAHVSRNARQALMTGDEVAPVEDVSQRVPPPGTSYGIPVQVSTGIDYQRLAAEIVRQQAAAADAAKRDADDDAKFPPTSAVDTGDDSEPEDDSPPP